MPEHFIFSGSFDTMKMTPEQKDVFIAEVQELISQSIMYVQRFGRDSEHGPIDASVHNVRVTVV